MIVTDIPSPVSGLRLGHCGPVLVSVFDGWPTGPILSALTEAQLELAKAQPRLFSLAIIPAAPQTGVVLQQEAGERMSGTPSVPEKLAAALADWRNGRPPA